ncbi:MAG: C-terminal binding protein [bacterium]
MAKNRMKVVVTDYDYPSLDLERKVLEEIDPEFVGAHCITEEEVIAAAEDADGLLNQYAPLTRRVIKSLDRCKVICRYGVGVDNIDVEAATERGIIVANVPDYCVDEVSTHAIALILACARKVAYFSTTVKKGKWDFTLGKPLFRSHGRVLGLFGLGRIGGAVARKARGFNFRIIAYDPYISEINEKFELVSFCKLLSNSDFLSIHAPLTPETKHSFGKAEFKAMKRDAYLINTARGAIVDEFALYRALKEGWIAGAALDVMEKEPPDLKNPLLKLDNVIITPHVSYYSEESYAELKTKAAQAVLDVLKGELPQAIVNPQVVKER